MSTVRTARAVVAGTSAAVQDAALTAFAALPAGEKAAFELIALSPAPIALNSLFELLRLSEVHSGWRDTNAAGLAKLLMRHPGLVIDPRAAELRAQGGIELARAAARSLIDSGRLQKLIEVLEDKHKRTAIERIEAEYRPGLRQRLRLLGLLAGWSGERLRFSHHYGFQDPIDESLRQLGEWIRLGDDELLDRLDQGLRARILSYLLRGLLASPRAAEGWLQRSRQVLQVSTAVVGELLPAWLEVQLLRGDVEACGGIPERFAPLRAGLAGLQRLRQGEPVEAALIDFDRALKSLRELTGSRAALPGLLGKCHLACLAASSEPKWIKKRDALARLREPLGGLDGGYGFEDWRNFCAARASGQSFRAEDPLHSPRVDDFWWRGVLVAWSGQPLDSELRQRLELILQQARAAGWDWFASQVASVLGSGQAIAPDLQALLRPQAAWETALDALAEALAVRGEVSASPGRHSQLQVVVEEMPAAIADGLHLRVMEQRPRGEGWTSGRELQGPTAVRSALDRLPADDGPDRRLLNALVADGSTPHYLGYPAEGRVVAALIEHPRVINQDGLPLQVEAGQIAVSARRDGNGRMRLLLQPERARSGNAFVQFDGQRLRVFRPDAALRRVAGILGSGLELPTEAAGRVLELLPALAGRLRVEGDLAALGLEERPADPRPIAQLEPLREGLALTLVVRPLGQAGVACVPGQGPALLLGQQEGRALRCQRDLGAERQQLDALCNQLAVLAGYEPGQRLERDQAEPALDLLAELQGCTELALEWRAGKPWRLRRPQPGSALQLQVKSQRDWFAAAGGLTLDDGAVVDLAELLRALPSLQGRYLRLDDERILALNQELRRRLQTLAALADGRGQVQVPASAAAVLEGVLDDDSRRDAGFRRQLQAMERAQALQPALPIDFQAELRDYQIEGFRFLMRLAAWGGGACLADDMGLGKTVQTLAMLCARAAAGPALVLAPTSVIGNWRREAQRFAPALNVKVYAEGDREATLAGLGAGDLLLLSYGLLAQDIEALAAVAFASLVLDEAQAIKNPASQRAQAARRLNASFRMAATGTPLENHLGELWSLFRVLNPGLLGSEEAFRKRFLLPLERDPRGPQREVLRRLLAPFLLRRTKAEVLTELPPRTEIVLPVEPSAGEARLAAALRRQALQRLHDGALAPEQRRMQILAELTRLRRAACHPQLVAPELGLPSSKLEAVLELLRELIDNRHRSLVFSQFVDYLSLLRERLDAEGIRYQYLDGSTPVKAREAAVAGFQRGEGALFLLSLKAGGVGLNLTAADYVIHLDPWWNPAVEQQASDRAHRIGQTRPVTVYKLVLAGSIEEQILALHGAKRELIDQVIGDSASLQAPAVDELLSLLEG